MPQAEEKIGESRAYWTHKVDRFPSPVAQFRMAQLVDLDERLYENARIVYRFLVGWYHDAHGDALLSMRHVSKVMRARSPEGATVLSHSVVQRAIIALMETGWVVRTFKGRGKGKGASRYVPVLNVLELAAQGKFPEPSHCSGTVEPSHSGGTDVSRTNGTVEGEPSHSSGTKTLIPDPLKDAGTGKEDINDCAGATAGLSAAAGAQDGVDELYAAYGVRQDFSAARIEYEKLAPSAEQHAEIIAAARAWRSAAGGIERMRLARWLREKRFMEDPKGERPKPTDKPKDKPTPTPANDQFSAGDPRAWPPGRHIVEIVDTDVKKVGGDTEVIIEFRILDGQRAGDRLEHRFFIEAYVGRLQEEGQAYLSAICSAVGVAAIEDTSELEFYTLAARAVDGRIAYGALDEAEAERALALAEAA
jgi:hypothetical protein